MSRGYRQQNLDCRKIPASPDCEEMTRFLLEIKLCPCKRGTKREFYISKGLKRHVKQLQWMDLILIQIKTRYENK